LGVTNCDLHPQPEASLAARLLGAGVVTGAKLCTLAAFAKAKALRTTHMLKTRIALAVVWMAASGALAQSVQRGGPTRLLAFEGRTEVARAGAAAWTAAITNQLLANGDRVRTGIRSRATIELSDRSILRVNELTTLEIRPPQSPGANTSFEMKGGAGYFFNRERPGAVEFRTPLASGAIRGTEFHLLVAENGRTEVTLIDGLVDLGNELGTANLVSGEQGIVEPGQPPRKTAMLDASSIIQWVLYYPAIIDADELGLSDAEKAALSDSLAAYRAGDLLAAQTSYLDNRQPTSDAEKVYRAATLLAVGQVAPATQLLQNVSTPLADALRQMVETVKGRPASRGQNQKLASEWMAESYALQAQSRLEEALAAARKASEKSPSFGFAWSRVAELEFSFAHAGAAQRALDKALTISPRNAQAHALRGFVLASRSRFSSAEKAFDDAITLDPALANAWLGRGLVRIRRGYNVDGRKDLQVAATLEPKRSVLRSYLGKAWSHTRNTPLAEKELRLAQKLDENDPTPWLYSAILAEQQNKVNEAIRDLERSQELNENRSLFRSHLLLDQDKAVRSANLARIYHDAGMTDWSVREASRAVSYDYGNFAAHQFLANSYEALRDPRQINLRYEAPAVSEYFIANLLAPVGGTPLSATVSQQEYTRLFERNHIGIASSTEYFDNGDWIQQGAQYGRVGPTEWSLESYYRLENGQRQTDDLERMDFTAKVRQQITPRDTIYFEGQRNELRSGDVIPTYQRNGGNPTLRIKETQNPNLFLGYHHEWAPGVHTLALGGVIDDTFRARFSGPANEIFYNATGGVRSTHERPFNTEYHNDIEGYLGELQQIFTYRGNTLVLGGRVQSADSDARDVMMLRAGTFPGMDVFPTKQHVSEGNIDRESIYAYDMWQVFEPLHLTAGVTYDHLTFPKNQEIAPIGRGGEEEITRVSPKAGFIFTPIRDTTIRGAYTRSVGGVFFDNSLRLEPTEVAGFNQTYRSLVPESVIGNVPGTRFETFGLALEQKFPTRTYLTVAAELLTSKGTRTVGVYNRFLGEILAEPGSTPVNLRYRERSLTVALNQLVSDEWAFGARYKLTDAQLHKRYTRISQTITNEGAIDPHVDTAALLHQFELRASYTHRCGFFSEVIGVWWGQDNYHDSTPLKDEDFWQLHAFVGYRFLKRHAEVRLGVLNITDENYRLNPLTLYSELPRERTFYASFRFYF
jgi:tetratricopeptide (TPR) repeat protein